MENIQKPFIPIVHPKKRYETWLVPFPFRTCDPGCVVCRAAVLAPIAPAGALRRARQASWGGLRTADLSEERLPSWTAVAVTPLLNRPCAMSFHPQRFFPARKRRRTPFAAALQDALRSSTCTAFLTGFGLRRLLQESGHETHFNQRLLTSSPTIFARQCKGVSWLQLLFNGAPVKRTAMQVHHGFDVKHVGAHAVNDGVRESGGS